MEPEDSYQEPNGCVQGIPKGKGEEAKYLMSWYSLYYWSNSPVFMFWCDLIPFFFRIQQVGNEAYVLGLSSFHIPSIGAACVCFLELLGLDSLKLRVDMKVANVIMRYKCKNEDAQYSFIRESLGTAPFTSFFFFLVFVFIFILFFY